jgi:hypothetical protein
MQDLTYNDQINMKKGTTEQVRQHWLILSKKHKITFYNKNLRMEATAKLYDNDSPSPLLLQNFIWAVSTHI